MVSIDLSRDSRCKKRRKRRVRKSRLMGRTELNGFILRDIMIAAGYRVEIPRTKQLLEVAGIKIRRYTLISVCFVATTQQSKQGCRVNMLAAG
jgi:hypothetical protein